MSASTPAHALEALHERLRACRLCLESGHDVFPRAIFSGGMGARWMVIGQAPGITEKEAGRPFNAGSGTRLFQWLEQAGVEQSWFRASQYMTSVTKCYPGRSGAGGGDRLPTRREQALCQPYLEQEIALVDPQLIIPVGRLAIGLFYPPGSSLEEIIGTQKLVDGRWIVPLPHPSGASRWHQIEANRMRVSQAIHLLKEQYQRTFI